MPGDEQNGGTQGADGQGADGGGRSALDTQSGQGGASDASKGASAGQFAIPEAYKDKPWASKVKSYDDLFKQVDSLDGLVGKKVIVPDLEKGPEAEVKAYLATLRGDTQVKDYVFPEGTNAEVSGKVAQIFFDNGIPKALGNKIIAGYAELGKAEAAKAFSKEGMEEVFKSAFGDDFKKVGGETAVFLKEHLSEEDQKMMDMVPNNLLGLFYRFANKVKTEYGATETGKGAAQGKAGQTDNKEAIRKEIITKMSNLSKRPYEQAEKDALQAQLEATYK